MSDMQAVWEALNRRRSVNPSYFPVYPGGQKRYDEDCQILASYADLITDPTPLTVEGLVEAGAIVVGNYYWFGCIHAFHSGGNRFDWYIGNGDLLHYPPRTVGELRQLLLRIGEKS